MLRAYQSFDNHDNTSQTGDVRGVFARVRDCIREQRRFLKLRLDINHPVVKQPSRVPLVMRGVKSGDVALIIPRHPDLFGAAERAVIAACRRLIAAEMPGCYVGIDERNGEACCMQWVIRPPSVAGLRRVCGGWVPSLAADEALLIGGYVSPEYRGKGILSQAIMLISDHLRCLGVRYVVAFVREDSVSVGSYRAAGFMPDGRRLETRFLRGLYGRAQFERVSAHPPADERPNERKNQINRAAPRTSKLMLERGAA